MKNIRIILSLLSGIFGYFLVNKYLKRNEIKWKSDLGSWKLKSSDGRFEIKMLHQHSSKDCNIIDLYENESITFPCLDECKKWAISQLEKSIKYESIIIKLNNRLETLRNEINQFPSSYHTFKTEYKVGILNVKHELLDSLKYLQMSSKELKETKQFISITIDMYLEKGNKI